MFKSSYANLLAREIKFKAMVFLFVLASFYTTNSFANEIIIKTKKDAEKAMVDAISNNNGVFWRFNTKKEDDEHFFNLGTIPDFKRYSAIYRNTSSWMIPSIGNDVKDLPEETQFLLIDRGHSGFLMIIPLVDETTRCSLGGLNSNELELIGETGDEVTQVNQFLGLYILAGDNPHEMIKKASKDIQSKLKTFKLRVDKNIPLFTSHFGWCTWNALSVNLSQDTLTYAMKHFKKNKIPVKYMIMDNGWQTNIDGKLSSYSADSKKFPSGLDTMIKSFKKDYGLEKVIMWGALWGTFSGLNESSFPDIEIKTNTVPVERMVKKDAEVKEKGNPEKIATMGKLFYPGNKAKEIVIPDFVPFYDEYFNYLRKQGVDGVKIDAMTWVESVGQNRGGRVANMRYMMQGLQSAVNTHFNNEMINCSSLSNDYIFNALTANVTRTSGDFFPDKPESHGQHIYTNAHTSFWLGEFILPDWDMFQSGHKAGGFHAAARAISGGPVYTTDVIGAEDKNVLNKLMTSTGRIPLCNDVGRVCSESLFTNPADNKRAIKIYNTNLLGGIVGAFNCSYNSNNSATVSENIKASDIENISGEQFAVYCFSNGNLSVKSKKEAITVKLDELNFDLFTYVPLQNGFAPIGIIEKYNPAGMLSEFKLLTKDLITIKLLEGGQFMAYSERKPSKIYANSKPIDFNFKDNKLVINVPKVEDVLLVFEF